MHALQNFAFDEHLVRAVERDGEPWFVGKDVCECLDLKNHRTSLELLDEDEKGVHTMDTLGGEQTMIIVSEAGVYRLVFRSRKPEAERFKRWLAHEVLPQIRRTGAYAPPPNPPALEGIAGDERLAARVEVIRLAMRLFGVERARALWVKLAMPAIGPLPAHEGLGEAVSCLRHILDFCPVRDGRTVRDLIRAAFDEDVEADVILRNCGIRTAIDADGEGMRIASNARELTALFAATEWSKGRWTEVLRRLPGARPCGPMRAGEKSTRGTFLPSRYLDEPIIH